MCVCVYFGIRKRGEGHWPKKTADHAIRERERERDRKRERKKEKLGTAVAVCEFTLFQDIPGINKNCFD